MTSVWLSHRGSEKCGNGMETLRLWSVSKSHVQIVSQRSYLVLLGKTMAKYDHSGRSLIFQVSVVFIIYFGDWVINFYLRLLFFILYYIKESNHFSKKMKTPMHVGQYQSSHCVLKMLTEQIILWNTTTKRQPLFGQIIKCLKGRHFSTLPFLIHVPQRSSGTLVMPTRPQAQRERPPNMQ